MIDLPDPSEVLGRPGEARRRLALCLDSIAAACLIAGMAALLAIADTRTFGASKAYIAAVVGTAPALGAIYVMARRRSTTSRSPGPGVLQPRRDTPYVGRELRRRLASWLIDMAVWFCVLNVVLLPGNLVLTLNRWLDRSKPVEQAFVVDGKRWLHKDKRAYFAMPHLGISAAAKESVLVSTSLYDRIVVDRTKVVLTMHDGAFGFPWTKPADLRWADLAPSR